MAEGEEANGASSAPEDEKAAKRRKLAEAKAALLARIQEEEEAAPPAEGATEEKPGTGEDDAATDCPVADLDIVSFLREESEAAAGFCLADEDNSKDVSVVACKEAKMQRRDPRTQKSETALAVMKEGAPALSNLPPGARMANKASGDWAWGGSAGGVSFARPSRPARPPAPSHGAFGGPSRPPPAFQQAPITNSAQLRQRLHGSSAAAAGPKLAPVSFVPAAAASGGGAAGSAAAPVQAPSLVTSPMPGMTAQTAPQAPNLVTSPMPGMAAATGPQAGAAPHAPASIPPLAASHRPMGAASANPFAVPAFQSPGLAMAMAAATGRRPNAQFVAAPKLGSGAPRPTLTQAPGPRPGLGW